MATTLPFNYAHLWAEMYKGIDDQGPYYEVGYLFDSWSDSDSAANNLMGLVSRTGGTTTRGIPHQHPLSPNLYCRSCRIEGVGNAVKNLNGYPNYDGGFMVRATYRARATWDGIMQPSDDPFNNSQIDPTTPVLWCTQELDFDAEVFGQTSNSYKWTGTGVLAGVPVKIQLGLTVMRLTFHKLPYIPMGVFRSLRGKVNTNTFLGAAAGTVLFKGASTVREQSTDGTIVQRVTMTFVERTIPWNKFPKKDTLGLVSGWDFIVDGSGNHVYDDADLTPLLQV